MSRSKRNKKKRGQNPRPKQSQSRRPLSSKRPRPLRPDEPNLFLNPTWVRELLRNAIMTDDAAIGVRTLDEPIIQGSTVILGYHARWTLYQQILQEFTEERARGGYHPEFFMLNISEERTGRVMRDIITFPLTDMPEFAQVQARQGKVLFPDRLYRSEVLLVGGPADGAVGYIEASVPTIPEALSPADPHEGVVHHYRTEDVSRIGADVIYEYDKTTTLDGQLVSRIDIGEEAMAALDALPSVEDVLAQAMALEGAPEQGAPRLPALEPLRTNKAPVIPDAPENFTEPGTSSIRITERKSPGEVLQFETSHFLQDGYHQNGIPYYQAVCQECGERMPKRRLHWVETEAEKYKEYFDAQTRALKDLLNHEHENHPEKVTEARKREILREYDRLANIAREKIEEVANV